MAERVQIKSAEEKKRYTGQYGERVVYRLNLERADGSLLQAETVRKPTSPVPNGFEEGELVPGQYGMDWKRAQQNGRPGGGGKSPQESAKITRMHSQEMALRWLTIKGGVNERDLDSIKPIIDWFTEDAEGAAPAQPVTVQRPTAQPAQPTEAMASAKQRGLINGKAGEKELTPYTLANIVKVAAGQPAHEWESMGAAEAWLRRNLDRLPARLVDPVLEGIANAGD
jgi:hypothetical protein